MSYHVEHISILLIFFFNSLVEIYLTNIYFIENMSRHTFTLCLMTVCVGAPDNLSQKM